MKELVIASNMIALARSHKDQAKKRSAMLRMIMPLLSKETGDKLATAIQKQDSRHFIKLWDHIKHEITHKLDAEHRKHHHKAVASSAEGYADVSTFQRDGETAICIDTYGPRKIRIAVNGNTVLQTETGNDRLIPANQNCGGMPVDSDPIPEPECTPNPDYIPPPADCGAVGDAEESLSEKLCTLVKLVCERLLLNADPCPLPPVVKTSNHCAEHDWPDCAVCLNGIKGFDFHANILELHEKLLASSV